MLLFRPRPFGPLTFHLLLFLVVSSTWFGNVSEATCAVFCQETDSSTQPKGESQSVGSQIGETTDQEKSLAQRWQDYLLSPVSDQQRQEIMAGLNEAERKDLESALKKSTQEFDPVAAQVYLTRLCEMGPRISGTAAMRVQQAALEKYFKDLGATVVRQEFSVPHPETRKTTELANLIIQLHPERRRRILICCHYDTRPYADQDPNDAKATLPGANDGANDSGFGGAEC